MDETAVLPFSGLRYREWSGGSFPRIRVWILCLLALEVENTVSYTEASWMEWVKGSCGVPHPVLQC